MVFKIGPLQSENIEVDEDQKKVNGINDFISTLPFCQSCLYGKQKRMKNLPRVVEKAQAILELIHSDVCGQIKSATLGGTKYFVTFIDDYFRSTIKYFMNINPKFLKNSKYLVQWWKIKLRK
jgi:hypothetical protein